MVEKGWIGGGNTGRNTTIIRSNYLFDESIAIYEHALKMWEGLSQALNYNVMYSPRGVLTLAHTVHDAQVLKRYRTRFPRIELVTIDAEFGGWQAAQRAHFADGGSFDRIYLR